MSLTFLEQLQDDLVDLVSPWRPWAEGDAVARHGVPLAHCDESAIRISPSLVLQHCRIVDERMQAPV
jgi:hypothetical protein